MPSDEKDHASTGAWRFGHLGETQVLVSPGLIVMGIVLVVAAAPWFESSSERPYLLAVVFALGLYASVFVHELAHVATARGFGMRVPSVTLHMLGGETAIEGESRSPWQELVTAGSGPLASAVIGLLALWGADTTSGATSDVLWAFGWVNVLVAAFNALPGLPLDGGRVFRAIVWLVTGDEGRGVVWAAWLGRLTAVVVMAYVLLRDDAFERRHLVDIALAALVAFFLWSGASTALRFGRRTARVRSLSVARLVDRSDTSAHEVAPDLPALPLDLEGAALLRAMAARPAESYVVTDATGDVVGILHSRRVDDAYREAT